jgi:hypothetical protein
VFASLEIDRTGDGVVDSVHCGVENSVADQFCEGGMSPLDAVGLVETELLAGNGVDQSQRQGYISEVDPHYKVASNGTIVHVDLYTKRVYIQK